MLILLLTACLNTDPIVIDFTACAVHLGAQPNAGSPGEQVTLLGGPFSAVNDTVVRMDGVDAEVIDVTREECTECDSCKAAAGCDECGACDDCTITCETCSESVVIEVPDLAQGETTLVLVNRFGTSDPVSFTVE